MSVKFDKAIISVKPFSFLGRYLSPKQKCLLKNALLLEQKEFSREEKLLILTFDSISCKKEKRLCQKKNRKLKTDNVNLTYHSPKKKAMLACTCKYYNFLVFCNSYIKNAS